MTTKPKTRNAAAARPAAIPDDPIFAVIAEHKAREKEWLRLGRKLDEAEYEARETHGQRPPPLIAWRDYSMIGEGEIDRAREEFLDRPGADREQVEAEYQDAKARQLAAKHGGLEWDQRAGVAELREQFEAALIAERQMAVRMARTKPTTVAGAAALVRYVWRDINESLGSIAGWSMPALKTAATALARIGSP